MDQDMLKRLSHLCVRIENEYIWKICLHLI